MAGLEDQYNLTAFGHARTDLSAPKLAQPTASHAPENASVTPEMAAFNELQRQIQEVGKMMDAARGDAFQTRMSHAPSAAGTSKRTVPPGPRTGNCDASKAVTAASSNPQRTITVSIEARVKKELLQILGRTQRSYPADKEMDGAYDHLLSLMCCTHATMCSHRRGMSGTMEQHMLGQPS